MLAASWCFLLTVLLSPRTGTETQCALGTDDFLIEGSKSAEPAPIRPPAILSLSLCAFPPGCTVPTEPPVPCGRNLVPGWTLSNSADMEGRRSQPNHSRRFPDAVITCSHCSQEGNDSYKQIILFLSGQVNLLRCRIQRVTNGGMRIFISHFRNVRAIS